MRRRFGKRVRARIKHWEQGEKYLTVFEAVRQYLEVGRLAKAVLARGLDHIPEMGNAPRGILIFAHANMVLDAKMIFEPLEFEQLCRETGLGDVEGEAVKGSIRMGEFFLQDQDQEDKKDRYGVIH
jgi:hypothetical protein